MKGVSRGMRAKRTEGGEGGAIVRRDGQGPEVEIAPQVRYLVLSFGRGSDGVVAGLTTG